MALCKSCIIIIIIIVIHVQATSFVFPLLGCILLEPGYLSTSITSHYFTSADRQTDRQTDYGQNTYCGLSVRPKDKINIYSLGTRNIWNRPIFRSNYAVTHLTQSGHHWGWLVWYYRVGQKSDTPFNYVNTMSYKLQNIRYLYCLNKFNVCY